MIPAGEIPSTRRSSGTALLVLPIHLEGGLRGVIPTGQSDRAASIRPEGDFSAINKLFAQGAGFALRPLQFAHQLPNPRPIWPVHGHL